MDMSVSNRGLLEIAEHEGIVPGPYYDSAGVLTYGIGHTANAGGPDPSELPRGMPDDIETAIDHAVEIFRDDVQKYERRVNRALRGVELTQYQFDALVSWDFNTGGATWDHPDTGEPAQLIRQLRAGDYSGNGFMGWLRPPEIRARREAEMNLFRTGDYDANGDRIPIWRVDANARLRGIERVMRGKELLARMQRGKDGTEPRGLVNLLRAIIKFLMKVGKA